MHMLIGLIAALTILPPAPITLQVDENTFEIYARNINYSNYFRLYDLAEALSIDPADLDRTQLNGRTISGHRYYRISEVADQIDARLHWVGGRRTILVDTHGIYSPAEPVFTMQPIPAHILDIIRHQSFSNYANAPFDYSFLTYLTVTHIDFSGQRRLGHMIVAAEIGQEVLDIFQEIYEYGFPTYRMRLIDFYGSQDYLSMADNNSVAFNFRYIAGTNRLSRHAFGMAIDINPLQNPYYRNGVIWPVAGYSYLDRNYVRPGMIVPGDVVYRAFTSRGWTWGGRWRSPRDYHHFERR